MVTWVTQEKRSPTGTLTPRSSNAHRTDGEAFEYYEEKIDELSVKPGKYQILYGKSSRDEDLQSFDFVVK